VATVSEGEDPTFVIDREDLGMLGDQPAGRRGGGRPEDDLDAVRGQERHRSVEPAELERAASRLERRPREFRQASDSDARFGHQPRVDRPALLRPLFRVVGDAEADRTRARRRQALDG
jgi:hypothetical protein